MTDRVLLNEPKMLTGSLRFSPTKRCFVDFQKHGRDGTTLLRRLSGLKMVLFLVQNRRGETLYTIYTTDGVYTLAAGDDTTLLTSFRPATLRDNNNCLKSGVSIAGTAGTVVSISVAEPYNIFTNYHNGTEVAALPDRTVGSAGLFPLIDRLSNTVRQDSPARVRTEVYQLPAQAAEYMDLAEAYANTDAELELAKAQQNPPVTYFHVQAARAYNRQDRTAYTMETDKYDQDVYKDNTKVQIDLPDGEILSASIIGSEEDEGRYFLTLLFDEQVSFSRIPKTGQIKQSYSDVQNEVRKDVIESIRTGETPARFLGDVFGSYRTSGFDRKNLKQLDDTLLNSKRPPNQSQMDAIHRGIETRDILLVLGPPGTGKTTVIVNWVNYFIKQEGKRVLISSQNNKAVDNVLERLAQEEGISAVRAGNEAKVQENMYPYLLENRLKSLRTDVESTMQRNLETLDSVMETYREYIQLAREMSIISDHITEAENRLQEAANREYGPVAKFLKDNQAKRVSLRRQLESAERKVRLFNKLMVDPRKHPLLRKLMTPLRPLFRKLRDNALRNYEWTYNSYQENISQGNQAYRRLMGLPQNGELIRWAGRVEEQYALREENGQKLRTPPENLEALAEFGWPRLPDSMSRQALESFAAQLRENGKRARLLQEASREWNEHIQTQSNYALSDLLLESVDLVGGTCIGINSQRKFSRINFDVTIIDESGQIQIHNALVPMSRSPKLIMLGDHLQIPPIADDDQMVLCKERGVDTDLLTASLFERLYDTLPEQNKVLLDTQYRMPSQIADLLSEWFYEGKYKSFKGKMGMPSLCPELFSAPFSVVTTSAEGKKRLEYKPEQGAGNHYEAELAVAMVKYLMDESREKPLTPGDFGIISPYGEQVDNIRRKLRKAMPSLTAGQVRDMVASLDSFQGQERSIIIYSCTRSNTRSPESSRIGFLRELRRLNVALSRPLKQLVFIGDIDFLAGCRNGEGRGSEREFSKFILLMKKHAQQNGEFITAGDLLRRMEGK